jgi:3-hydroxyacyl-[acyl-carrier-protein] dehydratase
MRIEYFQLVDRITDLNLAEKTIHAESVVPSTSTIFEGHFPGYPLMPGVLLIETMAQTSGWLVIAATHFERMPFLASVKNAKMRTFVTPGQTLSVTATILHEGSGYMVTKAAIKVADKAVCDAELTLRVMPFPNPELRASMEKVAAGVALPMEAAVHG